MEHSLSPVKKIFVAIINTFDVSETNQNIFEKKNSSHLFPLKCKCEHIG